MKYKLDLVISILEDLKTDLAELMRGSPCPGCGKPYRTIHNVNCYFKHGACRECYEEAKIEHCKNDL